MTFLNRRTYAIYSAIYALAIAGFSTWFHEFWRDETQAFLIGKYSTSLPQLISAVRYEGHPPLIYALFFVTSRILPIPYSLTVIALLGSLVLCMGTFHFLRLYFGEVQAIVVSILLSLTFTYAYEYGVVVRGYSLGIGSALWAISYFYEKKRIPLAICFLAVALLASLHSALLALTGVATAFLLSKQLKQGLFLGGVAIVFLFLAGYCILPTENRPFLQQLILPAPSELVWRLSLAIKEFLIPSTWWWGIDGTWVRFAVFIIEIGWFAVAIVLIRKNRLNQDPRFHFLLFWAVLNGLAFAFPLGFMHFGGYRHRFHALLPLFLLLLVLSFSTVAESWMGYQRVNRSLVAIWFLIGWGLSGYNFYQDYYRMFSPTKALAQEIPHGTTVLAEVDFRVTSLSFWRDDIPIRPLNGGGRVFHFSVWDIARSRSVDWPTLFTSFCRENPRAPFVTLTGDKYSEWWPWCKPAYSTVYPPQFNELIGEFHYITPCSCEKYLQNPRPRFQMPVSGPWNKPRRSITRNVASQ